MNAFITFGLLIFTYFLRLLPRKIVIFCGRLFGDLLRLLSKNRKQITLDNIRKALPNVDAELICKLSYRNLGITFAELVTMNTYSEKDLKKIVVYENIELINELLKKGKGLITLSGHYGNWELLAYTSGMLSGNITNVIVKPLKNLIADAFLNKFRTFAGNNIIPMSQAAKPMVKILKEGGLMALLVDQNATANRNVMVNFFGLSTPTYEAPASLALKFKTPLLIGFAVRQSDNTYKVKLQEIDYSDLVDLSTNEAIEILTQRHVTILENQIRERPDLWAWQHRRWKHSPGAFNETS